MMTKRNEQHDSLDNVAESIPHGRSITFDSGLLRRLLT